VVCDHASNYIPSALPGFTIARADLERHIAWDIGAAWIARRVAQRLQSTCVLANYSRVLVDCNRYPDAESAIPTTSDGTELPGNQGLNADDRDLRMKSIFRPYHAAVADALEQCMAQTAAPVFLSIHTCAPSMKGQWRPWHIGLGWTRDSRTARPLLAELGRNPDVVVGDNLPYDLDLAYDFTTPQHAMTRGLAHVQVEFRQDLVNTPESAARWADLFCDALLHARRHDWEVCQPHLDGTDGLRGATWY
jgi:predicted N-formylglutamate amidohydrolase